MILRSETTRLMVESTMASDTEASDQGGLLSLPPELMEAVANELPTEDLISLRLVCKDIDSKVFRSYTIRCFSEKGFMLPSPWSMQTLQNISQHPQFSLSMNRVGILATRVSCARWHDRVTRKQMTANTGKKEFDRAGRIRHRGLRQIHQAIEDEQTRYLRSGQWKTVLSQSLNALSKQSKTGISLSIDDRPTSGRIPTGLRRLQRALECDNCLEPNMVFRFPEDLLTSVKKSGCCIKELILHESFGEYLETEFHRDEEFKLRLPGLLPTSVQGLEMSFEFYASSVVPQSTAFCHVLNLLPELIALKLHINILEDWDDWDDWDNDPYTISIPKFLSSALMPKLQTLDLDVRFRSRAQVIELIRKRGKTLQELNLKSNRMPFAMQSLTSAEVESIMEEAGVENLKLRIE